MDEQKAQVALSPSFVPVCKHLCKCLLPNKSLAGADVFCALACTKRCSLPPIFLSAGGGLVLQLAHLLIQPRSVAQPQCCLTENAAKGNRLPNV